MKVAFGVGVGLLMLGLWFLYGVIGARLGADSVANVLVNVAIFVIVGIGVGFAWTRLIGVKGA